MGDKYAWREFSLEKTKCFVFDCQEDHQQNWKGLGKNLGIKLSHADKLNIGLQLLKQRSLDNIVADIDNLDRKFLLQFKSRTLEYPVILTGTSDRINGFTEYLKISVTYLNYKSLEEELLFVLEEFILLKNIHHNQISLRAT